MKSGTRARKFELEGALADLQDSLLERAIQMRESELDREATRRSGGGGYGGLLNSLLGGAADQPAGAQAQPQTRYIDWLRNLERALREGRAPSFGEAVRFARTSFAKQQNINPNDIVNELTRVYNQLQPADSSARQRELANQFPRDAFFGPGRVRAAKNFFGNVAGAFR